MYLYLSTLSNQRTGLGFSKYEKINSQFLSSEYLEPWVYDLNNSPHPSDHIIYCPNQDFLKCESIYCSYARKIDLQQKCLRQTVTLCMGVQTRKTEEAQRTQTFPLSGLESFSSLDVFIMDNCQVISFQMGVSAQSTRITGEAIYFGTGHHVRSGSPGLIWSSHRFARPFSAFVCPHLMSSFFQLCLSWTFLSKVPIRCSSCMGGVFLWARTAFPRQCWTACPLVN